MRFVPDRKKNMKNNRQFAVGLAGIMALGIALLIGMEPSLRADVPPPAQPKPIEAQIHHAIVMQPFYTVFDNIEFSVAGDTVTLSGQVTRPVLKSDLEHAVARIPGVSQVVNKIEVLPPSWFDDHIRRAEFRTLYAGDGPLSGYGWGAVPAIHIIVNGGHVTLTGTVHRQTDKDMATLLAKGVPEVFSVQNNLAVN
jgi:BON domain